MNDVTDLQQWKAVKRRRYSCRNVVQNANYHVKSTTSTELQGEGGGGGRQMQNMTPYSREKQQLRIQSMATHKPSFIKSISKYTKA